MDVEGHTVLGGHRHHMDAINTIRRAGSIAGAVQSGIVRDGIMHACVTHGVPFLLAGSIRDDGPLPEVLTDVVEATRLAAKGLGAANPVAENSTDDGRAKNRRVELVKM